MGKASIGLRAAALAAAAAMVLAACGGGGDDGGSGDGGSGSGSGEPTKGGTLTFLTLAEQIQHLDPQRNYTGEDLAFASAYLNRTLTSYKMSTDDTTANELIAGPGDRHRHAERRTPRRGSSRSATASSGRTARRSPARTSSTACRARSRPT